VTRLVEARARWHTDALGEFFCPGCGGDRNHRRQHGRRWLRLAGLPLLPLRAVDGCVQCTSCRRRYDLGVLEHPTSTRLMGLLRDAQYTIGLAMLAAGGSGHRAAREAACEVIREGGFEDHGEVQVLAALAALGLIDDLGHPDETVIAHQLRAALEPLAPHMAPPGLERLLLQAAWIALADGPYRSPERHALTGIGTFLRLTAERTAELLEQARHTSRS
jgi:hypothetical protein